MRTNERTRRTCGGTAWRITAITARRPTTAVTASHGGHCLSRRSRPTMADRFGRGSRPRRHEPGAKGAGQGANGAVRTRPDHGGHCGSYGGCGPAGVLARRAGRGADLVECEMAGERRARAARRGLPRGRAPPGQAGWSNKTNASTLLQQLRSSNASRRNPVGSCREILSLSLRPRVVTARP